MDTSRVGRGPLIAGVAGVLLFIFMFFGWFELTGVTAGVEGFEGTIGGDELESLAEEEGQDTSASAWQSFSLIDIVLLPAAIAAIALAIAAAMGVGAQLPVPLATVATALGAVSVLLILFRIISPPDLVDAFGGGAPEGFDIETDVGREIGVFLGLLAAIGVTIGGWLTMQEGRAAPRAAAPSGAGAAPPPPPPPSPGGEPSAPPPGGPAETPPRPPSTGT
jgi:hypothetical protein